MSSKSGRKHQSGHVVRAALQKLESALRDQYGEDSPVILVYGSQARGDQNSESDVDVLLIYRRDVQPGREIIRLSPVLAELNLRYQLLFSILPTSEQEYKKNISPFWKKVRSESISGKGSWPPPCRPCSLNRGSRPGPLRS